MISDECLNQNVCGLFSVSGVCCLLLSLAGLLCINFCICLSFPFPFFSSFCRHAILNTHQLKLSVLLTALHFVQETDVDVDELECIVANLIYHKMIKGYIAHGPRVVVVSKANAFPPLASVN